MIKEDSPSRLLSSLFTYVARDQRTGKACPVNKFTPQGEDEEQLFQQREYLAKSRKLKKKNQLDSGVIDGINSYDSQSIITSLVERGSSMLDMPALAKPNAVLMQYTGLENSLVCQPQVRKRVRVRVRVGVRERVRVKVRD
jgi:hypothetical protein